LVFSYSVKADHDDDGVSVEAPASAGRPEDVDDDDTVTEDDSSGSEYDCNGPTDATNDRDERRMGDIQALVPRNRNVAVIQREINMMKVLIAFRKGGGVVGGGSCFVLWCKCK
jgi:hypothetical protein